MKYQFMEQQRRYHRVEKMARVLEVSRSGFYMWLKRQPSRREQQDKRLVDEIRDIQENLAKFRYGSPRMTVELRNRGHRVGRNRVARLMRANGLNARRRKKFRTTTKSDHKHSASPNLVNREFHPEAANKVWASVSSTARSRNRRNTEQRIRDPRGENLCRRDNAGVSSRESTCQGLEYLPNPAEQ